MGPIQEIYTTSFVKIRMNRDFAKKFKNNRRSLYSFIALAAIFFISLFAEIIANENPLFLSLNNKIYLPFLFEIPETEIGGNFETATNFRDPAIKQIIAENEGFIISAPIQFSYNTINYEIKTPAPSAPNKQNILGTDDQGRDVLARIIYGLRLSLIFGIALSFFSLVIAILLGSIQGYFGGKFDLFLQRCIEVWSSMPVLFLLIILSAFIEPGFFALLILLLLFSWISLSAYIRAEFLRLRNFDFVRASKALGATNARIIFRHILPNSTPVIIANLPFLIASSITTLTSLDFLGLGMPVGSPSLGELLAQGKNNLNAYWLGASGFITITLILTLLVFIAEGLREAFDTRK